jgi:predicted nucleotidyltransferase
MRSREGDLVQTRCKSIFDVKGLVHPPDRVIAFPRFIPDSKGNRRRKAISYKKVYALSERYRLLEESSPQYLVDDPVFGERLCEVPKRDVKRYYSPNIHLRELRESKQLDVLETAALRFVECLRSHSNVAWNKLGISGSILCKLHTPKSDVDPVVYGARNCRRVYETLKSLSKDGKSGVRVYSPEELRTLYNFRSRDTQMPFGDFVRTECRKVLQGKFLQHDYFIRCVKDRDEVDERYGDVIYKRVGYAKIRATVSDDLEAILTPCRYHVENVRLLDGKGGEGATEIASFRGRFCEQARTGETVVAQGKVEEVKRKDGEASVRLLLGGKPSDFMALDG